VSGLFAALDVVMDRLVVPGYSKWGFRLRRRTWPADDPEPGVLRGGLAVVTGAGSGLGKATALGLARLGAAVVLAVRDEGKGQSARDEIIAAVPSAVGGRHTGRGRVVAGVPPAGRFVVAQCGGGRGHRRVAVRDQPRSSHRPLLARPAGAADALPACHRRTR
jgi:NAD(P)-dependent dehydrogenase (short-subunit alcohol dehydrogenase family)